MFYYPPLYPIIIYYPYLLLYDLKDPEHQLRPSLNFCQQLSTKECIIQSWSVQQLLNHLLCLIHPALFEAALLCQERVQEETKDLHVTQLWTSVFHALSVISNGTSRAHRDTKGYLPWYDILISIGTVDELSLNIPELHLKLSYTPGTVIALTGHALMHEVNAWQPGKERACWAFFFRSNVLRKFGISLPDWCHESTYS